MNGRVLLRSLVIAVVCTVFIGSAYFVVYGQQQEQQQQQYGVEIVKVGEFGERLKGVEFTVYEKTSDGVWKQYKKGTTDEYGHFSASFAIGPDVPPRFFTVDDEIKVVESKPLAGYLPSEEYKGDGKVISINELVSQQEQHVEQQQQESQVQESAEDPEDAIVLEDTGVVLQQQESQVQEVHLMPLEVKVENKLDKKDFLIHKVDQDGKPLEGAEFKIYGKGKVLEIPGEPGTPDEPQPPKYLDEDQPPKWK